MTIIVKFVHVSKIGLKKDLLIGNFYLMMKNLLNKEHIWQKVYNLLRDSGQKGMPIQALSGIDIDLSIPPKKIVCNDDELFFGAIAILKIFSKCGGKISKLSKFFLRIKILYFLYNFSYYLFSRNRSRFSFMIPYINC